MRSIVPAFLYCNATFDSFLCWPPTLGGVTVKKNCPEGRYSDTRRFASRRCGVNGNWLGRKEKDTFSPGWTNYTNCFPPEMQSLFAQVYEGESSQAKMKIAQNTRMLEITGYITSFITLTLALIIFSQLRSLRNYRTMIHKNLFAAMMVNVIIRLVLYGEQLARSEDPLGYKGIENFPYVCEGTYILLEYTISSMFFWMLVEGIYLHSLVSESALHEQTAFKWYFIFAWGVPVLLTSFWACITGLHYSLRESVPSCWYGYNFIRVYWISQTPRLIVIIVNLVFLFKIIYVLIRKLQICEENINVVKKSVRAALVLLPLLGITNILSVLEPPLDGGVIWFGVWSYSTHLLRSYQGCFVAIIYCFANTEVKNAIYKKIKTFRERRAPRVASQRRRRSNSTNAPATASATTTFINNIDIEAQIHKIRPWSTRARPDADMPLFKNQKWTRYEVKFNPDCPVGILVPRPPLPDPVGDSSSGSNGNNGHENASNRSLSSPFISSCDLISIGVSMATSADQPSDGTSSAKGADPSLSSSSPHENAKKLNSAGLCIRSNSLRNSSSRPDASDIRPSSGRKFLFNDRQFANLTMSDPSSNVSSSLELYGMVQPPVLPIFRFDKPAVQLQDINITPRQETILTPSVYMPALKFFDENSSPSFSEDDYVPLRLAKLSPLTEQNGDTVDAAAFFLQAAKMSDDDSSTSLSDEVFMPHYPVYQLKHLLEPNLTFQPVENIEGPSGSPPATIPKMYTEVNEVKPRKETSSTLLIPSSASETFVPPNTQILKDEQECKEQTMLVDQGTNYPDAQTGPPCPP